MNAVRLVPQEHTSLRKSKYCYGCRILRQPYFFADIVIYTYNLHNGACSKMQMLLSRQTVFYGISHLSCNVKCRVIISVNKKASISSRINRFQNYNIIGSSQNIKFLHRKPQCSARVKPVIPHNKAVWLAISNHFFLDYTVLP